MSTGLTTPAGGMGYDFSSEEGGGVAGRRRSKLYMTALLGPGGGRGNTISRRFKTRQDELKAEASGRSRKLRMSSGTLSSLRSKAGSILSSKGGSRRNSRQPEGQPDPPQEEEVYFDQSSASGWENHSVKDEGEPDGFEDGMYMAI